jgi:hypothetical protein
MLLSIAGVVIALDADSDGPPPVVDGAARAFVVPSGVPDIDVRCVWGDLRQPSNGRLLFDSGGLWQLHERDDRLVYSFTSPLFPGGPYRQASFDRQFRRGLVTLDRRSFAGRPAASPLEYPLDELMVINRLVFEGGIEVHGCGVVDESGAGYLFAGQSGAGKSTTARLWAHTRAAIVSDDRVILRRDGDGITMHGTPWHGDAEFAAPIAAPLTRIFLLRQAPRQALVSLTPASAAALLFSCTFPVFHDADALDRTLAVLSNVVEKVPVDALEFAPTPDVIDFVQRLGIRKAGTASHMASAL